MPNFIPSFLHASDTSFTTSPFPSFQWLFFTECLVYLLGHKQKPSWCLAVRIAPLNPASFKVCIHCSAFNSVGLNRVSDSLPSPHSRPVKVLVVKCIKAFIS